MSAAKAMMVARLVGRARAALRKAYELLVEAADKGRPIDFTNAPDIGIDELHLLVKRLERIYYQEG